MGSFKKTVLTNLRHIRKKADHAPERVRDGLTPPPVPFIADPEGERRSLPLDFGIEFVAPAYEETTPVAEAATSVSSRPKPTPRISIVIAIIVFCGASLLVVIDRARFPQAHSFRIGLALFICLVVLAHRYAADIDGRGTTSVAVVPMIGASLLFNGPGIAVAAAVFALVAKFKAHSPIHRMLFNFGCMLLADGAAVLIFREMVHGPLAQARYVQMLVPGFLAGLTFYLVNHLLICLIRSMAERRRALDIWSEDYRWLWPHYVMAGSAWHDSQRYV